jgi:hypothetical protein
VPGAHFTGANLRATERLTPQQFKETIGHRITLLPVVAAVEVKPWVSLSGLVTATSPPRSAVFTAESWCCRMAV